MRERDKVIHVVPTSHVVPTELLRERNTVIHVVPTELLSERA